MRAKCLLISVLAACTIVFPACRKNRTTPLVSPPVTEQPGNGTDTIPSVPGNPEPEPIAYKQVGVHIPIGKNVGGFYEALPPSYDSVTDNFPLLIFLHGGGELGDGSSASLPLLLKNSLTRRIHEKTFPVSFELDGRSFSFIVLSPQFREWPDDDDVHAIQTYALENYRVDPARIYVAGLSMGGGATWEYAGSKYGKSVAAIVPICGASWADSATAKTIAANQVPAWAFHNEDDSAVTVKSTSRYARLINAEDPMYPVKVTYWPSGGHDAWTKASDPDYREEGKNMYEWILQYVR